MDAIWAAAAFPNEFTVFSVRLRPFCSGHEILLHRIESPIVLGKPAEWLDIFLAVLICSQSFEDGLKIMRKPRKLRWLVRFWRLFMRKQDLRIEAAKFTGYLNSGMWTPDTSEAVGKEDVRKLKAPRAFRLIPFLCSNLNMSESEALNFPIARACAYYGALGDKDGEIDLVGETDISLIERLKALEKLSAEGKDPWDF
jgi:hypothetical protein